MTFKAMMIIFVIEMGGRNDVTPSGQLEPVLFPTMEMCEFAKAQMEEVIGGWKYDSGKENERPYPVSKSIKCVKFPANTLPAPERRVAAGDSSVLLPVPPQPQLPERTTQRWSDQKRWNE